MCVRVKSPYSIFPFITRITRQTGRVFLPLSLFPRRPPRLRGVRLDMNASKLLQGVGGAHISTGSLYLLPHLQDAGVVGGIVTDARDRITQYLRSQTLFIEHDSQTE